MKYKMVHTDENKGVTKLYFKTRRQARAARRAILKNKWFKCYGFDGKQLWWISARPTAYAHIEEVTVKKVEYE